MSPNDRAVRDAALRAKQVNNAWLDAFVSGLLDRGLPPADATEADAMAGLLREEEKIRRQLTGGA